MKRDFSYDVLIIGGGASGLAAAIELGMDAPGLNVAVLEKNSDTGRKIRATGSGRCNISNAQAEGCIEILSFFSRIGLMTKTYDNGLIYPYSESASDVAMLLRTRTEELGVSIHTDTEVLSLKTLEDDNDEADTSGRNGRRFVAECSVKGSDRPQDHGRRTTRFHADHVIIATGGKAGPSYGTTGDGYRLARELGHNIVTPVPVLTSVECREWEQGHKPQAVMLAGTRTGGVVGLFKRAGDAVAEVKLFEEKGEIQFTRSGISGICVFNMTRHMRFDRSKGESLDDFVIKADLFPAGNIEEFIADRKKNAFPGEKTQDVLRTVLKENIASYVIMTAAKECGNAGLEGKLLSDLTSDEIGAIARTVKELVFEPVGLKGWKDAQATSGGVRLDEIDSETCESRLVSGLYITGELADRDFPCGGFNLSNAWLTGMKAARAIASNTQL